MGGGLDERDVRDIANTVSKDTLFKIFNLECLYNLRDSMENDKSQPNINAVGTRYTKLLKQMVLILWSKEKADKMMREKLGMQLQKQSNILAFLPLKNTVAKKNND